MNITSAQYTKPFGYDYNSGIKAVIDGEEYNVPIDPNNRHYQAIQEWVAEGNTIAEAD